MEKLSRYRPVIFTGYNEGFGGGTPHPKLESFQEISRNRYWKIKKIDRFLNFHAFLP